MDDFTKKIKKILDAQDSEICVETAALLLLQLNRNRILYQNIIRRKDKAKLRYELQKMYNFRIKDEAVEETKRMEAKVEAIVKQTFPEEEKKSGEQTKGKRPDHEDLPDEIKAKYLESQNIYPRMRKLHEQLKLLAGAKPCDRYEFLKELIALDRNLRENWKVYDAYVAPSATPLAQPAIQDTPEDGPESIPPPKENPDFNKINAARKYLSDNKAKLSELRSQGEDLKFEALLTKVQERIDFLLASGAGISDEQLNELIALGCHA
jgi:hypothetical protein